MSVVSITEVRQYLTFKLDSDVFALDVATVREVLDFTTVTKIPRTPEFMRGVINLRGSVVPVVDLRLAFGMSATEKTVTPASSWLKYASTARPPSLAHSLTLWKKSSIWNRNRLNRHPLSGLRSASTSSRAWANARTTS